MDNDINVFKPSVESVIEFLMTIFSSSLGYSCSNTARSALSSILPMFEGSKIGEHPLVSRFLKGISEIKTRITIKPNAPISKDTIARWIKTVLQQSGISLQHILVGQRQPPMQFGVAEIMKCAGRSSSTTFARFYMKPVKTPPNFGRTVPSR